LVALGNHQQPDIDYHATFSPVVKTPTIGLILSLALTFGWPIRQLDVKSVFLHGVLTEKVYKRQPPVFIHPYLPRHVCKRKKAIYHLKWAPRAWFHKFINFLLSHDFICSPSDTSMFVYHHGSTTLILLLYVDDIILTGSSLSVLKRFISVLYHHFAMKDLCDLHYFLGAQVVRNSQGISLTQHKYIHDLIRKFHMHTTKPIHIPSLSRTSLTLTLRDLLADPKEYKSMVGALQYLIMTRPDIAYTIHVVS